MYLFQFPKTNGLNFSPFCLKVETFLRVLNIDYEAVESIHLINRFSRQKFPAIQYNDELIQDSAAIIKFLEEKVISSGPRPSLPLDFDLSEKERDLTTMVISILDNSYSPVMACFRWKHDLGWKDFQPLAFASLPFPVSKFVPNMVRKRNVEKLTIGGSARYSFEELLAQISKILGVLSRLLGSNKYLLGDKFHTVDVSLYAHLYQLIRIELDTPAHRAARSFDNLVKYVERVEALISKNPHKVASPEISK